jgi:hypothetical protein
MLAAARRFTFNLIVPATTATFEMCQFGRTRHYVKATVDFVGALSERKKSAPVALWLRASSVAPGEPPEPFDSSFVSESAELGVSAHRCQRLPRPAAETC